MTKSHFCIGPFRAERVNLSGSNLVSGIPSPSAALGFAGYIARRLGQKSWDHRSVLIIHDLEEEQGRQRGEQHHKGARKIVALEVPESTVGKGTFSLLIEISGQHDLTDVIESFQRARFSGGTIFPVNGKPLSSIVKPLYDSNFQEVIKKLPRGYALVPPNASDNADIISFGELMSLEAVANRVYATRTEGSTAQIVPVPVGYRTVPDTYREQPPVGARDQETPFTFVDSAVGLGKWISIRRHEEFEHLNETFEDHSWQWACDDSGDHKMFSKFHFNSIR